LQRNKQQPHNKPNSNNSKGHFKHGKQKTKTSRFGFFCAQFVPSFVANFCNNLTQQFNAAFNARRHHQTPARHRPQSQRGF
jgi:hypothetical protein